MELADLKGNIIGVIGDFSEAISEDIKVADYLKVKPEEALKIVNLDPNILTKSFQELSSSEKNKVVLAHKLNEKVIILNDFTKGMYQKDCRFYHNLFKKISSYKRKIILVSHDINFFLGLVDHLYVIKEDKIIYETTDLCDRALYQYCDQPNILKFVDLARDKGVKIDYYFEFNDLLKAIYRLKQ